MVLGVSTGISTRLFETHSGEHDDSSLQEARHDEGAVMSTFVCNGIWWSEPTGRIFTQ